MEWECSSAFNARRAAAGVGVVSRRQASGWWLMIKLLLLILVSTAAFADDSAYIPMCLQTTPRPAKKNMILVLSGNGLVPYKLNAVGQPFNPSDATFSVGYMRVVKPDLALGLVIDGHTQGVSGFKLGFGYLFGD